MGLVQISVAGPRAVSSRDADLRMRIDSAPWLVMNASVSRVWFLGEPVAVQRRLVKAIGENAGIPLEFKHVEEILRVAAEDGPSGKELSLPLGWKVVREPEALVFVTPDLRDSAPPQDYDYELSIPGRTIVYEAGFSIETRPIPAGAGAGYNPDHLLDAASLPGPLRVRNWRPGDRFWPAHTKSPKKIKELLQERHVAQPERRVWPVVVSGDEIVWLRGFPSPAKLRPEPGRAAILIVDEPLAGQPSTEE
jgi:tRNA(Ile)-lysidine synthase